MTPRITTELWISAYRKRLQLLEIPAFITKKGDETAGAVLVKMNTLDSNAQLFQRSYDLDGNRVWSILSEGDEKSVQEAALRQQSFDPDIWVIEVEDKDGRHLLNEEGLEG